MKVKYKGKEYNIPKHYLADLKGKDRTAQIKSIVEGKKRPKTDFKSKRSGWVVKFEKKYKTKITDKDYIHKNILRKAGQEQVIKKGKGAYYSSGSRPNQTPFSWGYGRLASVILNGPARKIDKNIWDKYKV